MCQWTQRSGSQSVRISASSARLLRGEHARSTRFAGHGGVPRRSRRPRAAPRPGAAVRGGACTTDTPRRTGMRTDRRGVSSSRIVQPVEAVLGRSGSSRNGGSPPVRRPTAAATTASSRDTLTCRPARARSRCSRTASSHRGPDACHGQISRLAEIDSRENPCRCGTGRAAQKKCRMCWATATVSPC
jgi:hypothetical protein